MTGPLRVYVEFARELDTTAWSLQHAAGTAPDATPYGLGLMSAYDCTVRFRPPPDERHRRVVRKARRHLGGLDVVPALTELGSHERATADVVLCMDEEAGLPAVLRPGGPPVVSGVAWLDDPDQLSRTHRRVARHGLARMAGVFTQCSAMNTPLVAGFGVEPERLHYVPLGIDTEHFRFEQPVSQPRVFSVGDDRMRDHATLVSAVAQVHAHQPDLRFELATTLPVVVDDSFVTVHRRRMDGAVRGCYARASVVAVALHPNLQGSGLTVILETMASGRPLVVTDNPGLSDYVKHGETGLLVPPGDPRAMAEAVQSLIADPERARLMGIRGRQLVEQRFTSKIMARNIADVLKHSLPH